PKAAKRGKSGSPGRQPWDRFQGQHKPRSGGRASDSAAPAGLGCKCKRTPSACALGYVRTPLRGVGQPSDFKIFRSVKYVLCPFCYAVTMADENQSYRKKMETQLNEFGTQINQLLDKVGTGGDRELAALRQNLTAVVEKPTEC